MESGGIQVFELGGTNGDRGEIFVCEQGIWFSGVLGQTGYMARGDGDHAEEEGIGAEGLGNFLNLCYHPEDLEGPRPGTS